MKRIGRDLQNVHQSRQGVDVLAMYLDELERFLFAAALPIDMGMDSLDQRRLAHPARSPQQRIVGRQPFREPFRVVHQNVTYPVDAANEADVDTVHPVDGFQIAGIGCPDETVGGSEVASRYLARRKP